MWPESRASSMRTKRLGDRAEMSMSPWALKMIEEGGGGFAPHPYFRRQLNPGLSRETLLTQLGELACDPRHNEALQDCPRRFVAALESLERWWSHRDDAELDRAVPELNAIAREADGEADVNSPLRHLGDAATLLRRLARGPGDLSLDEFAEELRAELSPMPIFRGLTLEYLWEERARTYLGLRVGQWLRRLERE